MKKILLTVGLVLTGALTFAQTEVQPSTNNEESYATILTSIKPTDGNPVVFPTQKELDEKQFDKIEKIKQLILDNRENIEMVEGLRRELWRFENATVIELKN